MNKVVIPRPLQPSRVTWIPIPRPRKVVDVAADSPSSISAKAVIDVAASGAVGVMSPI